MLIAGCGGGGGLGKYVDRKSVDAFRVCFLFVFVNRINTRVIRDNGARLFREYRPGGLSNFPYTASRVLFPKV